MTKALRWSIAVVLLTVFALPVQAQRFGAQLSWGDDFDLGLGARLEFGLGNLLQNEGLLSRAYGIASFDYFFPDCAAGFDCNYWELNLNGAVPLVATNIDPYVGGGLNIARFSTGPDGSADVSDTDLGLNALAGLRFLLGTLSAFAEARLELGGGGQFVLTFGALFGGSR